MKFKVKSGCHVDGAKTFEVGDVVESVRELDKVFPNKFTRVEEPVNKVTAPAPTPVSTVTKSAAKLEEKTVRTKKVQYRVEKKGKNKYDVVDIATGKAVNEEFLSEKEANTLLKSL